uniref:P2X purinoceptor n=2 Tax=Callorhinchus milii TaxID=7868 RepID=V9KU17_CALMI|eukprot:gi/632988906/ref/XP_007883362.1/ PREDICTED: P2X purinoceptor 1 [Callorhinchus milii]
MCHRLLDGILDFFFEYETPRMVTVRNKHIGIIFRFIQLAVLMYIIGWVFLHEKGYQSTDSIISSVSVKMKGVATGNVSGLGQRVWDVADYTFPSQGSDSFVIMTNYIVTAGQREMVCKQHSSSGTCKSDRDCFAGQHQRNGQGIMTGKCIDENGQNTCEIFGWCPAENDTIIPEPPLLLAAENFTMFIKNSITFTRFRVSRRNLVESVTGEDLQNCIHHHLQKPLCPIFRLGDIVSAIKQDFPSLARKGGMIGMVIDWSCNLDLPDTHCLPTYTFHNLHGDLDQISTGFNFRYARYYREDGIEKRDLYKVFGIRFDIMVQGKAGKFNLLQTTVAIGSGIGVFGLATVVCDLVLLNFLPKRDYYKQKKFKNAETKPQISESKD